MFPTKITIRAATSSIRWRGEPCREKMGGTMSVRISSLIVAMVMTIGAFQLGAPFASAQSVRMELREIAPDVYVLQHPTGSSNSAFFVTEDGVVVFDSDIRTADQLFDAIRRTTDKPIRFMIISHPAGDHSTGGWYLREDRPVIIASRTQAKSLSEEELEEFNSRRDSTDPIYTPYRGTELVQPDLLFDGSLTLRFGGLTFQITEEGSAHSTSDVTLYVPERQILAMGDLFKSEMHTAPGDTVYETFGAARNWIGIVDAIIARRLDVETVIPGHGVVHVGRGLEDLEELRRYFLAMRAEVSRMIEAGMTEEEVLAQFQTPAEFADYAQADRIERYLGYYYRPLKAELDGR
jgi:cyclase